MNWVRGDAGLSLTELMVVMVLMGFVIGAAYGLQTAIGKASATSQTLSEGASTLGDPLEFMSRIVMQARSVATSGTARAPNGAYVAIPSTVASQPQDFNLAVVTDRVPFNGWWELNYFHIDESSPSVLRWDSWVYNDSNNSVGSKHNYWEMSAVVNNRTVGLPMMDYFGQDTSVRLTDPAMVASDIRYVNISLAVPTPSGGWAKDSRFVALRN